MHDPSVIKDNDTYYIFGSHMESAKSTDLRNWTGFSSGVNAENKLFDNLFDGEEDGDPAAFTYVGKNEEGGYSVWAPDVIYNKKMGKSLGNFFTVRDISEKYNLQILRFFMLQAHYRSPLNFSAELMDAAKNGLDRILQAASSLQYFMQNTKKEQMDDQEDLLWKSADAFRIKFEEAMEDDFNTADAISAIFELVKWSNTNTDASASKALLQKVYDLLKTLTDVCGLIIEKEEEILDSQIEALIEERQNARKEKNFKRADEVRDELLSKGILLEDTREGVKWKKA